jgi:hypothetical protein
LLLDVEWDRRLLGSFWSDAMMQAYDIMEASYGVVIVGAGRAGL